MNKLKRIIICCEWVIICIRAQWPNYNQAAVVTPLGTKNDEKKKPRSLPKDNIQNFANRQNDEF